MRVTPGTINDPASTPQWDDGRTSAKAPGANKWAGRQPGLAELAAEVEATEHLFDVYVEGDLVLQTDYPLDARKVVAAAKARGENAQVAYVGPERREPEAERRSRNATGTDGGAFYRHPSNRRES